MIQVVYKYDIVVIVPYYGFISQSALSDGQFFCFYFFCSLSVVHMAFMAPLIWGELQ